MTDKPPAPNIKTKETDRRGAEPGQRGVQPFVPTDEHRAYVAKHAFFLGRERTAENIGISKRTLERHFPDELRKADEEFLLAGSKRLAKDALEGDGAQLRFLLARRFPDLYGETTKVKHSGEIATPPPRVDVKALLEGKSIDECRAILAAIDLLSAAGGVAGPGDEGGRPESNRELH